ncbi:glycosyltransferase [Clostridium botulinum]|nr:glycosyltransferase [Clostridium botulinum]
MKPLVSIIIPVYNSASFLSECLDSVICQSYKKLEIICINDGSTDNSLSIIKKYAKKDNRIRYYTQKNKGQSAARNEGLKMCSGEYVSFVDSDDMIDLNTISIAMDLLLNNKLDAVIYNMEMFLPNNIRFSCFTGELFLHESIKINTRCKECIINYTNAAPAVLKKSTIKEPFIEGMIYEDWVFMVRYLLQSLNVFWLNKPLYKYRRNFEKSTTSNISSKCLDLFKAYYLSKESIENSVMKNTYNYINDIKILNESAGFIHANLIDVNFSQLTEKYINELAKIVLEFPDTYYYFLTSFINIERVKLLNIIRQYNKSEIDKIKYYKVYNTIKNEFYGIFNYKIVIRKFKLVYINLIFNIKNNIKKLMRILFPAYRVSSSTREILERNITELTIRLDNIENKITNKEKNIWTNLSEEEVIWILKKRAIEKEKHCNDYNKRNKICR